MGASEMVMMTEEGWIGVWCGDKREGMRLNFIRQNCPFVFSKIFNEPIGFFFCFHGFHAPSRRSPTNLHRYFWEAQKKTKQKKQINLKEKLKMIH
ncbi:hypothetical protein DMENIID0001_037480 [Sergentomyia squamirostris]